MLRIGLKQKDFAAFYGMSLSNVKSIVRREKLALEVVPSKKTGRKCKLGPRFQRRLLKYVRKNNEKPLYMIAVHFTASSGTKLSVRTIQRYLHKNDKRSFVAASKPHLTLKHINRRLNWCAERN